MMLSQSTLYLTEQIRNVEKAHASIGLMEMAGLAIVKKVRELVPYEQAQILIIAGPGNNGGDALVAARLLRERYHVTVLFHGDKSRLPADAANAYEAWLSCGGKIEKHIPDHDWALVIDGLFGVGLSRPLDWRVAKLIEQINAMNVMVLSIDLPSGICANTGRVLGTTAIRATHTLTLIGLKPGLFTLDGPDHAGQVSLDTLWIESGIHAEAAGQLLTREAFARALPRRLKNVNKGDFGDVAVIGGADHMVGAALLAARAALMMGAGKVYLGLMTRCAPALDMRQPELMLRPVPELLQQAGLDMLVVGPGLGQADDAKKLLQAVLTHSATLLLDADALNLIAGSATLKKKLRQREQPAIITPHPGEAARLLGCSTADIQADRVASALRLARELHVVTVLKGCGTLVATPSDVSGNAQWFINASGNPGMAAAGLGDVLAGLIGGLALQGVDALSATLLGVHLHGAAADSLVAQGIGPIGLTASEVSVEARRLLNQWQV
ncbi:MAG TPA: NAD(P)H-hydrate dehydratase [Methylophilaceae bacterium]|nr:NAD(P)H-hydrate dehydratase [Methylophilaceae bacterium]